MKLLYNRWMREMDSQAIDRLGIASQVLMENAARGSARWFAQVFPPIRFSHAMVLAGGGNNGGDGMGVARILSGWGYRVDVCLMANPADLNPDAAAQYRILRNLEIPVHVLPGESKLQSIFHSLPREASFVVDSLLGTGIRRPVTAGPLAVAIAQINASALPVAAVDIPSGLSEEFLPGEGLCVQAHCTATFHAPKVAHLHPDGNEFCGRIRVVDIGIPPRAEAAVQSHLELITHADVAPFLSPRRRSSHKGDFGHVLSVAGSVETPGAGILSAYAALRSGAGLSTLALPAAAAGFPVMRYPEIMSMKWSETGDILRRAEGIDCLALGPGLGSSTAVSDMVAGLLRSVTVPMVLDADALNALDGDPSPLTSVSAPVVITPHPGEFSRLTGLSREEILRDRFESARRIAMESGITVVLKGHHTVVASPDGGVKVNTTGNPGMATAGSGDVLTGMIAAMIAQHGSLHPLAEVVAAAVFLHGFAGDLAARRTGEAGMTAGDLLEAIPLAMQEYDEHPGIFEIQH